MHENTRVLGQLVEGILVRSKLVCLRWRRCLREAAEVAGFLFQGPWGDLTESCRHGGFTSVLLGDNGLLVLLSFDWASHTREVAELTRDTVGKQSAWAQEPILSD